MYSKKSVIITKTLAIFSPAQNAYSETFIQAHRKLPFNIRYYYDGYLPHRLEGVESLQQFSFAQRIRKKFDKRFDLFERALLQSLQKEKVDIVLAEYGPTACMSLKVIAHLNIPLVVHFHGYDASQYDTLQTYNQLYRDVFAYAQKVIVVSGHMKETLLLAGCPSDKLQINYYGPDNAYFDIQPRYQKSQFVAVGRFVEKKAPQQTIRAFKILLDVFPEANLIMVGDGALLDECKLLASQLGIQDSITFKGALQPEGIQQIFEQSIAFVQHSVRAINGDSEGTPVAILEAQAAGLPVVSTWHAGIPDIVIHNETGLLVKENDVADMASQMIRLLTEAGLASRMGAKGRERIKEHYTMEMSLAGLSAIIHDSI
ncbi:MAG: glycosyltransferase [Ferruginibacter sp.]